ncbi:DUF6585 family protein [Sandaracinus amylolyticus]|uniref:Uncharacterized protein n=1 Tax=Sandaracinus amylolyticus TaxID=927083 RepID=A0A0F6W848_9BACT|nr:DUF6585 family protein [Sandaracinus amylolyticus]AKF09906.1 hypothetical protein DB32_007055 [Sandaracinus amylolyticus]
MQPSPSFEQQFGPQGTPGPYRQPVEPAWMRHDRTAGHPEDDFLVPVEPAIGPVLSACTNRTKHGWHRATKIQRNQRIAAGVLGFIFGGIAGAIFAQLVRDLALQLGFFVVVQFEGALTALLGLGGALFGTALLVAIVWFLRRPQATFVGKQGLMRYTRGLLFGPKHEVFRFDDASELKVQRIRHFVNGVYTGTNFDYTWRDANGKIAFRIAGQFRDDGALEPTDPVHFAFAAESAWSAHRIQHFDRMIAQQGIARFACGRDWIGIGKGFLEIGASGRSEQIRIEETQDIHFEQGMLVIKKKGAKEGLFKSEGVYRFPVAALTDFQVFLVVLEEQTGVRFR